MTPSEETNRIRGVLEDHERRISELERLVGRDAEVIQKRLSIREFLLERGPRNDVQKTLAIGYYLERHQGETPFNLTDLKGGFKMAKERLPSNLSDKVNKNIAKGHMMEDEVKKDSLTAWVLTASGERFVEDGFEG